MPDPRDVPGNYSRVFHSENISYVPDKGLGPGATKTKRGGPYLQGPRVSNGLAMGSPGGKRMDTGDRNLQGTQEHNSSRAADLRGQCQQSLLRTNFPSLVLSAV